MEKLKRIGEIALLVVETATIVIPLAVGVYTIWVTSMEMIDRKYKK